MFRSLTDEEATRIERWQAPRIGMPIRGAEGEQSPLHQIDMAAVGGHRIAAETEVMMAADDSLHPSASMIQKAYDEGHAKGLADAAEQSRHREVLLLEPLIKAIELQVKMDEIASSEELIELSRAMAALILHREVREDSSVLKRFVDQAVNSLDIRQEVPEVRLNSEDFAMISEAGVVDSSLSWKPDAHLPRGSCIVNSGASRIRAGIVEQLERVIIEMDLAASSTDDQDLKAA